MKGLTQQHYVVISLAEMSRQKAKECLEKATPDFENVEGAVYEFSGRSRLVYKKTIAEVLALFSLGFSTECVLENLHKQDFESVAFDSQREDFDMRLSYIVSPPVIEEGKIVCKKCKSKSTISRLVQLRSADEPASQMITCRSCGFKWRLG